ncbi:hypothetical protein KTD31_01410 [Burkholderia multivorans]|uniref:hypothetical protein n=1 Tax=Burkholderia multivorans TaxID=87883 RepID=UPI001C210CB0|nr:hypothetical protein [Burkholderia multivorans]MBU9200060.1 hypothetical protein [Burkholderia multivorans]MDN8078821.1 hypothetical protein [Burkholderia multivorans]
MRTLNLIRAAAGALLIASSTAHALEYEVLPRCWWPTAITVPLCLLEEPEVVNCKQNPDDVMCEDYPGATKAVTAKMRYFTAKCRAEYEITYPDMDGTTQHSKTTVAIDCATYEPISEPR